MVERPPGLEDAEDEKDADGEESEERRLRHGGVERTD